MGSAKNPYTAILKKHKLKVTQPRLEVLEIIDQKKSAVSQPELERILGAQFDRVTLYRNLTSFEEKGILHKIFDLNGTATYALCSNGCTAHQHVDQHAHFICSKCNTIYCLDKTIFPEIATPSGFQTTSVEMNVIGVCAACQQN